MLFVDDNMSELLSAAAAHPELRLLHAKKDPAVTLRVLENYPGLLKLDVKREDRLRKNDILANEQRQEIQKNLSLEDYIRNLATELTFDINNISQIGRIAELSRKTNQFIFSYRRYSERDVSGLMTGSNSVVVGVSLKDNLSDSGIIGGATMKKQGDTGFLDECFVSCRALGRGLDEMIVLGLIKVCLEHMKVNKLQVSFTKGERNLPAEKFVKEHFHPYVASGHVFSQDVPINLAKIIVREGEAHEE